ncbi:terminase large subunit [Sinorhizobium phage phiM7]|uniref:Terminase DNA packaging enzyme large subunit n=2 Tax=Emdodecavirus TaxID=1980937 RepID=S5MV44_9CAUD|nr:terminase large subunit [Sinorhizobium phage phiM12]YP_009601206.1 terminase large subunit [Sinorhizobium phage phiM7]AGR47742.2 terminase DNA packaging enzyme large subunit [Sinorhizobium phage phiM12]AKF12629.1 terminase large subunit [Sinorhizobium phage phiM7]AKF12989.1 terminase large subunit [Sinorhizobium phage phiM19]
MTIENSSYLGNTNLKAENTAIEWTPEMVQEYVRCRDDILYFAENYMKIVNLDEGFVTIKLYPYQKELIKLVNDNRMSLSLQSRQSAKTTTATIVLLHYILFNEHKTVAILANKKDTSIEVLSRIQLAYEALPKWLQHGVKTWNKGSIELENGCKVIAAATSSSAIRGKSINFLYIDEVAFIENWDTFFTSTFPTISSGKTTKIFMTSTPNGLNHWHSLCKGAKEEKNGYKFFEVKWQQVPGRDEQWKDDTLAGMNYDYQKFDQEYNNEFLGSSGTLIDGPTLKNLADNYEAPLKSAQNVNVYAMPEKDRIYTMVVDVSHGKGLDYSAFHVFDITSMPYKQVCTFHDNFTGPVEYAETIHMVHKNYNNCSILVENNDMGSQVAFLLHDSYEIETLLYTENAGASGKKISGGFSTKAERGVRTTKSVKSIGCSLLKLLIEQGQLIIPDFKTVQELNTFSRKGTSYEAEPGKHDDLVMGLVLFAWLTEQNWFKMETDIETLMKLREKSEDQLMEEMLPIGFNSFENEEEEFQPVKTVSDFEFRGDW